MATNNNCQSRLLAPPLCYLDRGVLDGKRLQELKVAEVLRMGFRGMISHCTTEVSRVRLRV